MARRRSFVPVLLIAALALAVGAVAWFAFAEVTPASSSPSQEASSSAHVPTPAAEPSPPAPDAPVASPTAERAAPSNERAAVTERDDAELANAIWVEGRVRFPDGMPVGERVEVVADGKKFERLGDHRAPVAEDGRFRVAFSPETKSGWIKLDAPHLFAEPLKVKLGALPDDIVLEPQIGGEITGTIAPPAGAPDAAEVREKARVQLHGWDLNSQEQVVRVSSLDADWRYDLRGIPAHLKYSLKFEPDAWAPVTREDLRVAPGETQELELVATLGARLAGRIVDASDAQVSGATVRAEIRREPNVDEVHTRSAKLEKDGSFVVRGIQPGKVTLTASKNGFTDARVELGSLSDGEVREALVVRLDAGNFVAGRVTWPEGSAAAGAYVRVIEPKSGESRVFFANNEDEQGTKVDADGGFRVTGLGPGPYEVWASAREGRRPETGADGLPVKKSRASGPRWLAHADAVRSGTAGLSLVLQPGLVIEGRVVDETLAPVTQCTIVASESSQGYSFSSNDTATAKVDSADGRFQLEGLREGTWSVVARAKGYTLSQAVTVHVPGDGAEIVLTLPRCSTLVGIVVDGSGAPVAKATVRAALAQRDGVWRGDDTTSNATTDEEGSFELAAAPSGAIALDATHPRFAGSRSLSLTVAAGQRMENVEIVMTMGGTIRGRLHESLGDELAGWDVWAHSEGARWQHGATDASGSFAFERVVPGQYTVRASSPDTDASSSKSAAGGSRSTTRRASESVTVLEGETVQVVLGALAQAPVVVSGRVLAAGKPLADVEVSTWKQENESSAITGADGRYELTVDGSGSYTFNVGRQDGGTRLAKHVEIPEAATFTVDFEFEASHIAGRVLDADGRPVEDAWVQLQLDDEVAQRRSEAVHGWMRTGSDGAFRFEGLASGVYEISVTDIGARRFGAGPLHGLARAADLRIEDGNSIDGVEIRLESSASIEGIVRTSSGAPAIGARIYARDERGDQQHNWWNGVSDGAGHYRVDGLASGAWTVRAVLGTDASEESEPVQLGPGGNAKFDLALRSGTVLTIVVENSSGKVVGGALSVRDAKGHEHGSSHPPPAPISGEKPRGQRIGPLAPGTYEVSATNHDGVRASKSVSLHGQTEQEVTLRYGGS